MTWVSTVSSLYRLVVPWHGQIFRIYDHLWGKSINQRWSPLTKVWLYGAFIFSLMLVILYKLLNKPSSCRCLETPWRSRDCTVMSWLLTEHSLVLYTQIACWWLNHWGRVTHICVSKLTIIGSDNGLSPGRRQAIIWINVGILLIGPLGANFSEISSETHIFSFTKMRLKCRQEIGIHLVSASMC